MNADTNTKISKGLEDIIRELSSYKGKDPIEVGTQVIIVEKETGELVDEIPFFNLFKKFRYFEISRQRVALDVTGPELSIPYSNSPYPLILEISYDARISEKGVYYLIRAIHKFEKPVEGINNAIKNAIESFVFSKKDFVNELKKYLPELEELVKTVGSKCGLDLSVKLQTNFRSPNQGEIETFISCEHKVITKTLDGQTVEIDHSLALTLDDHIKFRLSGIKDIKSWVKMKLDQFTKTAIIEITYADVLVNMRDSVIKDPMKQACSLIGFELRQLITVPGLDIEKFYFETADDTPTGIREYITKDVQLKIPLSIVVDGRLDLHDERTKNFIKPGFDIIATLKRNVIEAVRKHINEIPPQDYFTSQFTVEGDLIKLINSRLRKEFGFKELGLTIKFFENNLAIRLAQLKEKPKKVELIGDWNERKYALWFRVLGVPQDGWYRFRSNNYQSIEEELNDIARMVKNGMESTIMRTDESITGTLIANEFNNVRKRVRVEFGLEISIHDFTQEFSIEEEIYIESKKDEREGRLVRNKMLEEAETTELAQVLKKKQDAIADEENEEVIKKLDDKIAAFKKKGQSSKAFFMDQKADNRFLLSPEQHRNEQKSSTQENDKEK